MHRNWLAVLACVLMVPGAPGARGASAIGNAPRYSVQVWETDDGLPHNSIGTMVQTRDGYLWLGTLNGLVRFDGLRFKVFDTNNTPGLSDVRITYLFEDSRSNLWIGTENAATAIMKGGRVTALPQLPAGGPQGRLRGACEDRTGAVWLLHENALWRYAGDVARVFTVVPAEEGRAIIQETNGPVWLGTVRHQYALGAVADNGSLQLPVDEELAVTNVIKYRLNTLVPSRRGGYWRLADQEIERWTSNHVVTNLGPYLWPPWEVTGACEDHEGNLVVSTPGAGVFIISTDGTATAISVDGISMVTTNGRTLLSANNHLSHVWAQCVLVDRAGTIWVGTDGGGLNRLKRQTFGVTAQTENWDVESMTEDADGALWVGSAVRTGLGYWRQGFLDTRRTPAPFTSLFADRQRRLWAGVAARPELMLFQMFPNGILVPRSVSVNPPRPVQAIHEDRAGRLWFGTGAGLLCLEKNEWKQFGTRDGLSSEAITCLADDASGQVWIGTHGGGINRFSDGQFTALRQTNGVPSDDITGLAVDEQGVLWVTTPAGLGRFHKGTWTRYTRRKGLVTDELSYVLDDGEGSLWIGSNAGILRVPKRALTDAANGVAGLVPCRAYEKGDGILTRRCTSGSQPGAWRGRDGTLWFATSKGVAATRPMRVHIDTNPPLVSLEKIVVDEHTLEPTPSLTISGAELLEIHYTSLELAAPERARFRYWLENYEKDWTEPAEGTRFAAYRRVPPGHYTFHVTAANEDGVWNEQPVVMAIVVPTPFWRTWWFLAGSALALFAVIAGIVHYFSTQKLQRQLAVMRQQELLEKERARIARDIHDQVGASLTQVALLGELLETDKDSPQEIEAHAQQISQTARETTRALDEIVWTVNPQNDTLEGLVNYLCKYAQDYLAVAGIRYRFEVPAQLPARPIPPDVRHNVFLASKEAVTNIVRHAKASVAWIRIQIEAASVRIEIEDNGRGVAGLDVNAPRTRHGLKNMSKRMEDIGGRFTIEPGREGGALVRLTVPLPDERALAKKP